MKSAVWRAAILPTVVCGVFGASVVMRWDQREGWLEWWHIALILIPLWAVLYLGGVFFSGVPTRR
jgi:hypothetical protein